MNYADTIVLRLADPATRAGIFDATALAQLLDAQYDTGLLALDGPYSAVFDALNLGIALSASPIRVEAFWQGRIVARTAIGGAHVDRVRTTWPDGHAVDAAIVTALGSLPADPAVLEHERRTRYLAALRAASADAGAASDSVLDDRLRAAGVASVGQLFAADGSAVIGAMNVHFSAADATVIATPLPVAFALLIRDGGSIAELLTASKVLREQLAPLGYGIATDPHLPVRFKVGIAWVVPHTFFDDPGWPGADATARRAAAGAWLAREGIGLVATA